MMVTVHLPVDEAAFILDVLGRYCGPSNEAMPAYETVRKALDGVGYRIAEPRRPVPERSVAALAISTPGR